MSDWRKAVSHRNRAHVLRAIADETEQEEHSETLRRVAEHFEKLADSLERTVRGKDERSGS